MKAFQTPVVDVVKFDVADVITTSGPELGENELPGDRDE